MAKLEKISYWHIDNDISIVTDKINNAFKAVARTFSKRQKREIDHGKYTFMTKRQILMVFGPNGEWCPLILSFSIIFMSHFKSFYIFINSILLFFSCQSITDN